MMTARRQAVIVVAALIAFALGLPFSNAVVTASAQTISVTSANPPSGEQGTLSLDVVIGGKGFKNDAKAKFYKTGTTDPAGVTVKATKYVTASQLVATIEIAEAAELSKFDIEVALADGRTGKGTELFSVTAKKIDPCAVPDPVPTRTELTSDVPGYPGFLDGRFGAGTGQVVSPMAFVGSRVAIQVVEGESRIIRARHKHLRSSSTSPRRLPDAP